MNIDYTIDTELDDYLDWSLLEEEYHVKHVLKHEQLGELDNEYLRNTECDTEESERKEIAF